LRRNNNIFPASTNEMIRQSLTALRFSSDIPQGIGFKNLGQLQLAPRSKSKGNQGTLGLPDGELEQICLPDLSILAVAGGQTDRAAGDATANPNAKFGPRYLARRHPCLSAFFSNYTIESTFRALWSSGLVSKRGGIELQPGAGSAAALYFR
jgi:hypothetical protein